MRVWESRLRLIGATVTVFVLLLGLFLPQAPPAQAASAHDFTPGHIISDANFYDGNAMTALQVQQFLNLRVPRCTIGDAGRKAGSKWGNTKIATKCLKDYRMNTSTIPSNPFCSKPYVGARNESAGQIIEKVGKACGISQKVLLVMLEKEQSLISDSWPTERMIDVAMGYGCPDTGPNWSANCNPEYFGFQNQVYEAAWVYKYYKANPLRYRYKSGQWNSVQWHPNPGCGSSNVLIENDATAALYIYTPYRPNQAALNAGWGTGDSCSSYGNRNFFLLYSNWFGPPSYTVDSRIQNFHAANEAAFGKPKSNSTNIAGGLKQEFSNATLYWQSSTGASAVKGGIRTGYDAYGGPTSQLGFPLHKEETHSNYWSQNFQNGTIYWAKERGAVALTGGIKNQFVLTGGVDIHGLPLNNELGSSDNIWYQDFDKSTITWSPSTKGVIVKGGIRNAFQALGGVQSAGHALKEETEIFSGGWWQPFNRSDIFWRKSTSGVPVGGGIRNSFNEFGGVQIYGFPLKVGELLDDGSWRQEFDHGSVFWSPAGGRATLQGTIRDFYDHHGSELLGLPKGASAVIPGGTQQTFTKGSVFSKKNTVPKFVTGGILNTFLQYGAIETFGFPTTEELLLSDGSWRQEFETASIIWSPTGGRAVLQGPIRDYYNTQGSTHSGFPKGKEVQLERGVRQEFTMATAYSSADTSTALIQGGIRNYFNSNGQLELFGFPLANEEQVDDGVWEQAFERGIIRWTSEVVSFEHSKYD